MLSGVEISIDDVTAIEGDDTGVFVDQFLPAPGLAGALEGPCGFVIGPDTNVYVASLVTDEILRYDQTTGDLIDVFVPAGANGLDGPWDLAFGPDGELYVTSYFTSEVLRYDGTTGTYIDTFISGGRIDLAGDVLFADDGTLFVVSTATDEVLHYDASGNFLNVVMSASDGLSVHDGNALMLHNGSLFVASFDNDQILRYNGQAVEVFVSAGSGGLTAPNGLDFGPDGNLYVTGCFSQAVHRYDGATGAYIDDFIDLQDSFAGNVDLLFTSNDLYLASWGSNLIARYDAHTGEYIEALITGPRPRAPKSIFISDDGFLYVANWDGGSVASYDAQSGSFVDYFVKPNSGGIPPAYHARFGPDGHLYVSGPAANSIYRYDGTSGDFIDVFISSSQYGLDIPSRFVFHSDGKLYVSGEWSDNVLRFDSNTGEYIDEFIAPNSGGLNGPECMAFGPDGHFYVYSRHTGKVLKYDGSSGAFMDEFSDTGLPGSYGGFEFGPDGNLYVTVSEGAVYSGRLMRFDGNTGDYIDDFVPPGLGGLLGTAALVFDANGTLYVANQGPTDSGYVMRYATASHAVFTVSLSSPSDVPVTVDYVTSPGSADSGVDFKPISGTLTFDPGVTTRSIVVPTIDDPNPDDDETFTVTLSNPTGGATLADWQGQATIEDPFIPVPLFSDSFENGQWDGQWVEDSQNDWFTSTQRATARQLLGGGGRTSHRCHVDERHSDRPDALRQCGTDVRLVHRKRTRLRASTWPWICSTAAPGRKLLDSTGMWMPRMSGISPTSKSPPSTWSTTSSSASAPR